MRNWSLFLARRWHRLLSAAPAFAADLIYQQGGATQATDPAPSPRPRSRANASAASSSTATRPAATELHLEGIDNVVVLDGDATLIYGGDISEGHMISEGEFQGAGLTGDTKSIEMHKDDIVQIPAGTAAMDQAARPCPLCRVPGARS